MKKLLFWGPVLTASGYGEHARQLLAAVLNSGEFDVSVCSIKWGQTPFINSNDEFISRIHRLISKFEAEKNEGTRYDVSIQVSIPNEFQKLAAVNIGVTAGIEVDRVSPEWIKKANENVDLIIVPSKHSATSYANVVYKDKDGGSELVLEKPVFIVPESFDSTVFNLERTEEKPIIELDTDFNFLSVGLGFDKAPGEDRKDLSGLVKNFCETFAGNKNVGLVLKANLVNHSLMDFETIKTRIDQIKKMTECGEFPKIHLVHGRLSKKELASLYKHPKIKAYVTTTHGEGYGLPIIEAAACGLPVIATNWSGHVDFLSNKEGKRRFIPLEFDLKEIPDSSVWPGVIEKGTRWAYVKPDDLKMKLKKVQLSPEKPTEWARELAVYLAEEYSEKTLGTKFVESLKHFLAEVSEALPPHANQQVSPAEAKIKLREQLGVPEDSKILLYTMPMSAGDVFISTAIIDSLKKKFPEHLILFGTDQKYSSILKDNPNIFRTIQFEQWMMNVPFCEGIFDEVYTPNLAVQLNTSNWVHGGKGRLLGHEFAAQCGVEFGEYFIKLEELQGLPEKFIVLHTGSGKGQWEARNYRHWKKVVHNLKKNFQDVDIQIVQVGLDEDPLIEGCVDLRGRTNYNQLAYVISKALCLVGIDSVTMHMAAALHVRHVSLFGSSYSSSTGPAWTMGYNSSFRVLLDAKNRCNGGKACYKYQCSVDRDNPCINEISPRQVVASVLSFTTVNKGDIANPFEVMTKEWDDCTPKIAGYTHVLDPELHGFPYIESIKSMLGFCDEVIVVDGGSTDGSLEKIKAIGDDRIKIFDRKWDWTEPGMDGMQKAYGRAMVSVGPDDFLWQQDADEVVHERDYQKIKDLAEKFPSGVDLIHLPVVELWGAPDRVRTDRHSWKWRMSRNNFRVTHGINKDARLFDEKTGRTFAKKGMSDGCEYVDIMTGEHLPHKGFYTQELETVRRNNPKNYGQTMNKIFSELPSVFHYSWADLPRKIRNFKSFWNKCWANLYNEETPTDRFPNVLSEEDVLKYAEILRVRGGEHSEAETFKLEGAGPSIMSEWFERVKNADRYLHDNEGQTNSTEEVTQLSAGVHAEESVQTNTSP